MSLYLYESFCLVAETKSISKAARILHASQPTIGAHIKSLEQEFGITLLNRSNHGVDLTDTGEIVYKYAKQLLHLHEQLVEEIDLFETKQDDLIKIGADNTVGNYILPYLLSNFKRERPHINTGMLIMDHNEVCHKVLNKEVHIGIIDGPFQCCTLPKDIKCGQISDDEIYLVAPPSLRKRTGFLNANELTKIPLIMPSKELKIREVIEQKLNEDLGMSISDLNVVSELNSIAAIKSYVISGYGSAFFCDLSIKREIEPNQLHVYRVDGLEMSMTYYFIYHRDCENTNLTELVNYLDNRRKKVRPIKKEEFINIKLSR